MIGVSAMLGATDAMREQMERAKEERRKREREAEMADVNGGAGIPRKGREVEYATELWLDDPTAFFLHPEGPLSDTTPEEWQAKQPKPAPVSNVFGGYPVGSAAYLQALSQQQSAALMQQYQNYQSQLMNANRTPYLSDLLNAKPGSLIRLR